MFADKAAEHRGTVTYATLQRVLEHFRHDGTPADLALVTGDIVQDDSVEAYRHFRELLASLGMPVYCLPGNHDIESHMRTVLGEPPFHYCQSVESDNWLIVSIDSCVSGHAGGEISAGELRRLEAEIGATRAEHILVCLHHPPVPMNSQWLDAVGLANGGSFLDLVGSSGKVRLVLFGHVHQAYDADHDGIRILGTPSTCRQFARGSDVFAVDDNPPAYRRIRLYTDGRFEHELIWVRDEPVY